MEEIKILNQDKKLKEAFKILRKGYPNKSFQEQTKGKTFRENSQIITDKIVKESLKYLDAKDTVAVLPWRSALAFVPSLTKHGIKNFYHISSKRNEETLETEVDFEEGKINKNNYILIADPMLATGNTIVDCVERFLSKGILEEKIIVANVLAAPEGVNKISELYPKIKIVIGQLDKHLDKKGYIVPGLGDFGDKYFSDFRKQDFEEITKDCSLSKIGREKILRRIKSHGVSEILESIIERDEKDDLIDELNKKSLSEKGLKIKQAKKTVTINTGKIVGIKNVVKIINKNIKSDTKIISLEGKSGVGKSSTTQHLAKKLNAPIFSMGDIFRYLTLLHLAKIKFSKNIFGFMYYKNKDGELKLFHNNMDIKNVYNKQLREKTVENKLPEIAKKYQKEVIEFCAKEIEKISKEKNQNIILIEGRAFTLDFLPSDLRIKLVADAPIRAERRWHE